MNYTNIDIDERIYDAPPEYPHGEHKSIDREERPQDVARRFYDTV